METTEKIVEAYVRYVRGWATIPNIKCGLFEIDLLAIDPVTLARYHIETSVSASAAFAKLTDKPFDQTSLKDRVKGPAMRRTLGFFVERKFGPPEITKRLAQLGFGDGAYKKIVVTWGWDNDAKTKADTIGIELWDFRNIMREISDEVKSKTAYFGDDTLRTLHLFALALESTEIARHSKQGA